MDKKQKQFGSIAGLFALLAALVVGVMQIFTLLESLAPPAPENPTEVTDAITGEASKGYALTILPPDEVEGDSLRQWLEKLNTETGTHVLDMVSPVAWSGVYYLPELTLNLSNANCALSRQGDTLSLYLSTTGLEEGASGHMFYIQQHERGAFPSQMKLFVNGEETAIDTRCIYNSGQWFWAEEP